VLLNKFDEFPVFDEPNKLFEVVPVFPIPVLLIPVLPKPPVFPPPPNKLVPVLVLVFVLPENKLLAKYKK